MRLQELHSSNNQGHSGKLHAKHPFEHVCFEFVKVCFRSKVIKIELAGFRDGFNQSLSLLFFKAFRHQVFHHLVSIKVMSHHFLYHHSYTRIVQRILGFVKSIRSLERDE
jgi:hypothetical protein